MAVAKGTWKAADLDWVALDTNAPPQMDVPEQCTKTPAGKICIPAQTTGPQPLPKIPVKPNHDYTFEVYHKGLDINGFIRHTDKHKGKHHKFRVYVDENQNGRFDKNDPLIGKTGLKQKFADKGVGNLLDENEIGQLEVKFKKSALMRSEKSCEGALDSHLTGVSSFFFADSDGNDITQVIPFGESCGPS